MGSACVKVCILFNLFLKYGDIREHFMQSVFVPLLKNKCGDLSDIKNNRAIAICNALSKVFESVLVDPLICHADAADQFQFGFKKGHSTGLCTSTFKNTVDYYRYRGSHVFVCFIYFSTNFDTVNYWKLFSKLLSDDVYYKIVRILA